MRIFRLFAVGFFVLFLIPLVAAQNDACSTIMQSALEITRENCQATGRNQVCYGNIQIATTLIEDAPDLLFEKPGDILAVDLIETIQLSILQSPDEWGVALMKIQADFPDTLPGQNVTVLLFGDVVIENRADNDDDVFGPMQAFHLRTGIGGLQCDEATLDGVLIQTPSGAGTATLDVNHVRIELGSTVFLTAVPDDVMRLVMLDGEATVSFEDTSVLVTTGQVAVIPLNADGLANGIPDVVPYDVEDFASLPIGILDEPIELPVTDISTTGNHIVVEEGPWYDTSDGECNSRGTIAQDIAAGLLIVTDARGAFQYEHSEGNTYIYETTRPFPNLDDPDRVMRVPEHMTILSPTEIDFKQIFHLLGPDGPTGETAIGRDELWLLECP